MVGAVTKNGIKMRQGVPAQAHVGATEGMKHKDVLCLKYRTANVKQVKVWHGVHNHFGVQKRGDKGVEAVNIKRVERRPLLSEDGVVKI